jgi:hypothetical protein
MRNAIETSVQHPSVADLVLGHRHHFLAHPLLLVLVDNDDDIFAMFSRSSRAILPRCDET